MSKHTPGPWTAEEREDAVWNIRSSLGLVARCPEFEEADARLIAAAPDMIAALERVTHIIERLSLKEVKGKSLDDLNSAYDGIKQVINKATGGV